MLFIVFTLTMLYYVIPFGEVIVIPGLKLVLNVHSLTPPIPRQAVVYSEYGLYWSSSKCM